jgi:hypothetical protein
MASTNWEIIEVRGSSTEEPHGGFTVRQVTEPVTIPAVEAMENLEEAAERFFKAIDDMFAPLPH